jgi:hypothetical protein
VSDQANQELFFALFIFAVLAVGVTCVFALMVGCMALGNMQKGYGFFESVSRALDEFDGRSHG